MTETDQKLLGKILWDIADQLRGSVWYDQHSGDVAAFEKQMRRKAHYVIQPQHLWANVAHMARTHDSELLNTLQAGFKYIENESFESTFQGLFSEINLGSEKLGKTYEARNDKLCAIITKIADGLAEFSTDSDTFGDAYEYLIGQFAAGSGPIVRKPYGRRPKTANARQPNSRLRALTGVAVGFVETEKAPPVGLEPTT